MPDTYKEHAPVPETCDLIDEAMASMAIVNHRLDKIKIEFKS